MTFRLFVLTSLYTDPSYVPHLDRVPHCGSIFPDESRGSYGAHVLDHLTADGAGFAGGEVAVVAVLKVDANLPRRSFSS